MLSEVSQTEENAVWPHLLVESTKTELLETADGGCQASTVGKWMRVVKWYKFPVIKMNKFWGCKLQHGDYITIYTILYYVF